MNLQTQLDMPPHDLLAGAALFLDFDGTLVEIADRPEDVHVPAGLKELLDRLRHATGQRLAIVSGRSVAVLRSDFGMKDVAIAGSHGNEISLGAGDDDNSRPEAVAHAIAEIEKFAGAHKGLLAEPKTMGVGLHFRLAPDMEAICGEKAREVADKYGLNIQAGKMLFEIYSGNGDKGSAIRKLGAMSPFDSGRPVFIGDDKTDENGFAAVRELGGTGILVGPARGTHAHYRLADVAAVHEWLEAAALRAMETEKEDM